LDGNIESWRSQDMPAHAATRGHKNHNAPGVLEEPAGMLEKPSSILFSRIERRVIRLFESIRKSGG
jgi:hypothetical protein